MVHWISATAFLLCLLCYFARSAAITIAPPHHKEVYHRSSNFGKIFLIVIPGTSLIAANTMGRVCFMTFENIVKIRVIIPGEIYNYESSFSEQIIYAKMESSVCKNIGNTVARSMKRLKLGHAIKIVAQHNIAVMINAHKARGKSHALVLPPISAYSTRFLINLPVQVTTSGFLVILASHENTLVTIIHKTKVPTSLALNASTFALLTWAKFDVDEYVGAHIEASKQIFIIACMPEKQFMMVMPSDSSFANSFVVMQIEDKSRITNRFYLVVQPWNRMMSYSLYIQKYGNKFNKTVDLPPGQHYSHPFKSKVTTVQHLQSTLLISVIVHCNLIVHALMNFGLNLVPQGAWPSRIYFRKPVLFPRRSRFTIHIIVSKYELGGLMYNNVAASNLKWLKIMTMFNYTICDKFIETNQIVITQSDPRNTFVAYVLAFVGMRGYFIATALGQEYYRPVPWFDNIRCSLRLSDVRPGDDIDNDCDNKFDEEIWNGIDDDSDGLVDEDLMLERAKGMWGLWQAWHCEKKCSESGTTPKVEWKRYRSCVNPPQVNGGGVCDGSYLEENNNPTTSSCGTTCDENAESNCPLGVFSVNCDISCPEGCWMEYCYKDSGECLACKTQYEYMSFCEHQIYTLFPITNHSGGEPRNLTSSLETSTPEYNHSLILRAIPIVIIITIVMTIVLNRKQIGMKKKKSIALSSSTTTSEVYDEEDTETSRSVESQKSKPRYSRWTKFLSSIK